MIYRLRIRAALTALLLLMCSAIAIGQSWTLAVAIDHSLLPQDVRRGETVTDQLTVRALQDLDELDLLFVPLTGVEVLSDSNVRFTQLETGDRRQVDLRVRLTADFGRVSVTGRTRQSKRDISDATVITFGRLPD